MPRSTSVLLASYGHVSTDVRDIGMGRATDQEIARFAKENRLCILTGDWDFSDIRAYPPGDYQGIAVIGVPDQAMPRDILEVVQTLLESPQALSNLSGRLAIIRKSRIRLRPAP